MSQTLVVCPFCGCGCGLRLEVKDNRLVRVSPSAKSSVNRGTLCVKGSYGYDFVHSPDRLTSPLIRTDGDFQMSSWEQALNLISGEFKRIKEKHGPDSLAVLGSSKCTNEENYLLQRFARTALGTNNIDNGSRLYSSPSRVGLGWTVGIPGTTGELEDLERSEVIMVVGAAPVGYEIVVELLDAEVEGDSLRFPVEILDGEAPDGEMAPASLFVDAQAARDTIIGWAHVNLDPDFVARLMTQLRDHGIEPGWGRDELPCKVWRDAGFQRALQELLGDHYPAYSRFLGADDRCEIEARERPVSNRPLGRC